MDSEELASMYAEILNGVSKQRSRFRKDPEFDKAWDRAVEEIERIRREHPDWRFDLPI